MKTELPNDGGSYARQADGTLVCLEPTTVDPPRRQRQQVSDEALSDVRAAIFAVPGAPTIPKRQRANPKTKE